MMDPHATCNAVRILSLDGGGIRGLSSLLILEHLMERVREAEGLTEVPRPCDRFDMIGGTSTGGIIAIMLGRLRMTVDECICAYRKMAERAFTPKRTTFLPASPSGAFSAKALEAAIRDTVKEFCPAAECVARRGAGHSTASTCTHGDAEFRSPSCTSTVVLAITKDNVDARPTLFTTYDTSTSLSGCTIWQVARATSAATTFFKPIRVGRDGIEFVDAGFGYNNPCEVLIEEAGRRFPGRDRMQVISIGTGLGDVVSISDTRIGIINALKKMATTSRAVAARLDDRFGGDHRYVRFNVEKGLEDTTLSDWKKASTISAHTRNYLSDNKRRVDAFVHAFLRRDWQEERTEGGETSVPESPPRKPCRYLPFQKNRKFVGRASILQTLKQTLFGDDDLTSRSVAIVGLGGVGKTQVALQMAYWTLQNKPEWHVFWVPALSMASFEQTCRTIVQMVGLEATDKEDAKELLKRYLDSDTSGRWFLIVDNIDDEEMVEGKEQGIRDFLPLTGKGRILFTTRVQGIAVGLAQAGVIDLSQMEEHEAIELLEKSLINRSLLDDKKAVAELLGILAHLPLAMAQAAAYLNVRKTSVAEYVRLLQNTERDMVELLETEFSDDTRYSPRQHKTANAVASTWVVSFEQIRKDVDAAMLLRFMAHIGSKAIPRSMLPAVGSEQRMTRAVGVLCGYSFLSVREDGWTYDMHRLVHLASRVWVSKQDVAGGQRRETLCHLRAIFSTDSWEERERWRLFLPHVLKAIKVDEEDGHWVEEDNDLGYWVGRCLQAEGRSREAVVVLERVVAVHETTLAETHPDRLASQHVLAMAYQADGRVKEAIELLERVVAVEETTLAETHPDQLASQHELARAYQADGQVKEAIELLERVVAVEETTLAETHPDRLASQHNLATVYYGNGEIKKVVALLEHVVNALKIVQSENNPQRIAAERWLDFLHSQ
ncbi:hypothetical protein PCL_07421 [Purpureocillium lilacinum]|uniref:PNPLA domain-containing protein n=1 Tax=Purpureocillium lilacinum TaxID=33203 RepID=A0A2U3DSA8_PURLI|nr:hypothetical protein PCL_07421 [Purpureocillium lilacinum]